MLSRNNMLCLFDIDGTLTKAVQIIDPDMEKFLLTEVKPRTTIGLVGGSDFKKVSYQMGGPDVVKKYDYVFSENGLVAYKDGSQIGKEDILNFMGEEKLQTFINYALSYMSKLKLPAKRGTFIEFRSGMINVSPVGRSCSQVEREQFVEFDKANKVRENFIKDLREKFPDFGLTFSNGGQISIDVFPNGWDKTFCLNYLEKEKFSEIHFFGDKTDVGGNDHELYNHPRTIGHKVISPQDTRAQLKELLNL